MSLKPEAACLEAGSDAPRVSKRAAAYATNDDDTTTPNESKRAAAYAMEKDNEQLHHASEAHMYPEEVMPMPLPNRRARNLWTSEPGAYPLGGDEPDATQENVAIGINDTRPVVAVAAPVPERDPNTPEALPWQEQQDTSILRKHWSVAGWFFLGIIVICGVVLLLVVLLETGEGAHEAKASITSTPSMPPTGRPMEEKVVEILPQFTLASLKHRDSPQKKAFHWLVDDPNVAEYSEERLLQRLALATLYFATDGSMSWRNNTHWLSYEHHECDWYQNVFPWEPALESVLSPRCEPMSTGGQLNHLWLSMNELKGTLPPEIYFLTFLKTFDLTLNPIGGSISSRIGKLVDLNVLLLGGMQMTGTVPTEIGACTDLEMLGLASNQLSGEIPFGVLPESLQYLWLDWNIFTGTISSYVGELQKLKFLHIYNNEMSGTIPNQIASLKSMENFDIGYSSIGGKIPTEIGSMTSLYRLRLADTLLSGTIPSELGLLTSLENLVISSNPLLTGPIPSTIGQLEVLYILFLSDNGLSGNIPTELGLVSFYGNTTSFYTQALRGAFLPVGMVSFANNSFSGAIPTQVGQCSGLGWIRFNQNQLDGTLPSQLGLLREVISFDVADNYFSGTIPNEMGSWPMHGENYTHLEGHFWDISGNDLVGSIPENLCYQMDYSVALDFDCSESICGCDCECLNYTLINATRKSQR